MTNEEVSNAIEQLNRERFFLVQKHNQELKFLRQKERDIMAVCSHDKWTYYPDPSGNNDSSYTCDFCGKDLTWQDRHKNDKT